MDNPDQQEIVNAVKEAVQEHVNGKIDRLDKRLEEHMGEVQPFLEGWKGGKRIGNLIKWFAGLIIAVGGTIAVLTNLR